MAPDGQRSPSIEKRPVPDDRIVSDIDIRRVKKIRPHVDRRTPANAYAGRPVAHSPERMNRHVPCPAQHHQPEVEENTADPVDYFSFGLFRRQLASLFVGKHTVYELLISTNIRIKPINITTYQPNNRK